MSEPARIPSGTVTLLFTDIEGSTRLWEAEPAPMTAALQRHDAIVRSAVEDASGYVFKTVGDAFCAAFSTPQAAALAALTAQRGLAGERWATSRPIRVRMGLHTGACEERDRDYFGPVVNRAARLEAAAHGGQVLVSGATAELLAGSLPEGVGLHDLGLHRLKDLGRPEQVFQLTAAFLQASFPPLASLDNPELPNNLPTLVSAFVGREVELAEVRELVRSARMVTLTGAGGSGKTRLALQAAVELIGKSPDGVWLAELASLIDGGQIPFAVAVAVGIQDHSGAQLAATVADALADQDALILLDNCEHLIDAAAKFCDEVIRHCPKVRFLATSREPLGIDGERIYRVPSLSLPDADADTAESLAHSDAVLLFAERARAIQPEFVLNGQSAQLAATICRRLDGIPLALELAAARLSSMSMAQIAARLDQRFRLLTGGSRNAMPRQQTLQATVDWSFGLLTAAERSTLTRLSVFAGGFDLEAAEAVCVSESVDALDVLDLLGSLVAKSLVIADHSPDAVRYRMLETIRQYSAQELLRAAGDDEVLRVRDLHAAYYLALAQAGAPALSGHGQRDWLHRFDAECDNLRVLFQHLAAEDRADDLMQLVVWLYRFILTRGQVEVLGYLRPVLDRSDPSPSPLLAEAMGACGLLLGILRREDAAELAAARTYGERALGLARAVGDRHAEARALGQLMASSYADGDMAASHVFAERALAIARELGNVALVGECLQMVGSTTTDPDERRRYHAEALACAREAGDVLLESSELDSLFSIALHAGRVEEGSGYLEESAALAEYIGGDFIVHFTHSNLALLRLIQGRTEEAAPLIRGALLFGRRMGPGVVLGEMVFAAACVAASQGELDRAARLFGAGDVDIDAGLAMRTILWSPAEQSLREREQGRVKELLGDAAYQAAYAAGARLTPAQARDLALGR
ncbi:MAG TPA: adenylate/guanylate cyclase domain-containing protein [Streptosporangiaceae bacterium]|nr:adenylate/guanylate cyclase domain-containing protein [Streptosporangiaceae bacterium]